MNRLDPLALPLSGTQLIEASAGTGKTWTIAALYLRLLLGHGRPGGIPVEVERILVVTFTRAATAELHERIRRRVREALSAFRAARDEGEASLAALHERDPFLAELIRQRPRLDDDVRLLQNALRSFDQAQISTIHSFCQRTLQDSAFECGTSFDAEFLADQTDLIEEIVLDFWLARTDEADPAFVRGLHEDGFTPPALASLVKLAVSAPHVPILPDVVEDDLAPAREARREAREAAHALWRAHGDEIRAALTVKGRLSAGPYKPANVESWCEALAAALASDEGAFDDLAYFTPGVLAAHTLKGRGKEKPTTPTHPFFDACERLSQAERRLQRALRAPRLRMVRDLVEHARAEVLRRKQQAGVQTFDDLLHSLARALEGDGGDALAARVRGRYDAALIDEFQDTDEAQYRVFRRVWSGEDDALLLIGDPKQAIYAFRGADIYSYLSARRDAGERAFTLETNHRSDPKLVDAVNALFSNERVQRPFLFDEIAFHPVRAAKERGALGGALADRPPLRFAYVPWDEDKGKRDQRIRASWGKEELPSWIAADVVRLLGSGATIEDGGAARPVAPGDVAILCRSNVEVRAVQRALREAGVPCVLLAEESVFDTAEAVEVERLLLALAEPGDGAALRAALATSILGFDAAALCALQEDPAAWEAQAERFRRWHDAWQERGFTAALRSLLHETDAEARLLSLTDGERRLTNVLHLEELLAKAAAEEHKGSLALVEWLHRRRTDASSRAGGAEAAQIRLESDARAAKALTIHKSKGLEFGIVYCPFLWTPTDLWDADLRFTRFHDPQDGHAARIDVRPEDEKQDSLAQALFEARAESMRLLYVALTRARHSCTVVWGRFADVERSALARLLHPADGDEARAAQLKDQDDDAVRGALFSLAEASGGAVGVHDLAPPAGETYRADEGRARLQDALRLARPLDGSFRLASFSSLTKGSDHKVEKLEIVKDRDEATLEDASPSPRLVDAPVPLADLPASTKTGHLVHWIFETLDFPTADLDTVAARVAAGCRRFGFGEDHQGSLARALLDVVDAPLGDGDDPFCLRQVGPKDRLNEMPFFFPLCDGATGAADEVDEGGARISSGDLAAALRPFARAHDGRGADGAAPFGQAYVDSVARLGFSPVRGFMTGAMDLALKSPGGRWYVVDYKSNMLGKNASDYAPSRLAVEMARHHYWLQSLVYTVALHRFLKLRLDGYSPERHLGGARYLFVRGMARDRPGSGVVSFRPSPALVRALDSLFSQGSAGPGANEEAA